tara:strand:- start:827 stop:2281 length:1455 start_codon:yes stop_codon:yes gene_type:complete
MKKAIIIGSGIGGLSTAIRLKSRGFDVDVFEKNLFPGGKLSNIDVGKYRFNTGPSLFTMPHFVDELYELFNENPRDHFNYIKKDIMCKYFWDNGKNFVGYYDINKLAEECTLKFGVDKSIVLKYLEKSKKKYDLVENIFIKNSLHKLKNLISIDTLKALVKINTFQLFKTLNKVNEEELKNKYLVQVFNRFATYNGSSPYKTPGMMSAIQNAEKHYGSFLPKKGMGDITKSLYLLAKRHGVKFHFNREVDKIIIRNNKACGVKINNKKLFSEIVVTNSDVYNTYRNLLNEKRKIKALEQERSSSAFIFNWGIKKVFKELDLHNIFFSNNYQEEFDYIFNKKQLYSDPTVYINITCKDLPNDSPNGCENWYVMVNSPYDNNQNWKKIKDELKSSIVKKINKILSINIEEYIEEERIVTPQDIESSTNSYKGSLYGTSSNNIYSAFLRHPNFSPKITNLYFCGGSVHPGGGIPLCIMSGKIISDIV